MEGAVLRIEDDCHLTRLGVAPQNLGPPDPCSQSCEAQLQIEPSVVWASGKVGSQGVSRVE